METEQNNQMTHSLDIKTLVRLLMEEDMPHARIMSLIARECNIPEERMVTAMTAKPEGRTRKNMEWNSENTLRLVTMWNDGERPRHIAAALGCSTQTVYARVGMIRRSGMFNVNKRTYHGSK